MKEVQAADQGLDEFDRTQRCSLFSQSTGDEPIGQARTPTHQVFVEAPLPWSRNFLDSQEAPADIKGVIAEARQAGVTAAALGIVPDAEYSAQGASHLFLFRRPEGLFSRFEKRHYLLPPDGIGPALRALLIEPGSLHGFDEYQQDSNDTREVFVCTHRHPGRVLRDLRLSGLPTPAGTRTRRPACSGHGARVTRAGTVLPRRWSTIPRGGSGAT